jgi:hypothetical protein
MKIAMIEPTPLKFLTQLLSMLVLVCCSSVDAQQQNQDQLDYLRFIDGDAQWEGELQTATVSFENEAGVQLNLVAAVHLGEPEYYARLNDYFATQDLVLYELVAEPNQLPVRASLEETGRINGSLIGFIQQAMAGFLDVSFQLDEIDYTQSNFLHADLTPSQLAALMADKNENFFSMFLNLAMAQLASQNASPDEPLSALTLTSLIQAMNSDNQNAAIKFLFAEELGRSGGVIVPEELEQQLTILGDRNRAALRVLNEALQNPENRKISIFYGAAHMPGIEREIRVNMGFSFTGQRWQSAWLIP